MYLKEELAFPISLHNQRNLSKKASPAASTKNKEWRSPVLVSLVPVKKYFLRDKRLSLRSKEVLPSTSLHTIIRFF